MMRRGRSQRGGEESNLRQWLSEAKGVTTTEAVILIALGVLVVLGGIQLFGGGIGHQYENVTRVLSGEEETSQQTQQYASAGSDRQEGRSDDGGRRGGGEEDDSGDRAVYTEGGEREAVAMGEEARQEGARGSVGGVNPLIILLLIGGVLAVGYFIYADDD